MKGRSSPRCFHPPGSGGVASIDNLSSFTLCKSRPVALPPKTAELSPSFRVGISPSRSCQHFPGNRPAEPLVPGQM